MLSQIDAADKVTRTAAEYGFLLVFACLCLVGLAYFLKRITDRHLILIDTLQKTLTDMAASTTKMANSIVAIEHRIEKIMARVRGADEEKGIYDS